MQRVITMELTKFDGFWCLYALFIGLAYLLVIARLFAYFSYFALVYYSPSIRTWCVWMSSPSFSNFYSVLFYGINNSLIYWTLFANSWNHAKWRCMASMKVEGQSLIDLRNPCLEAPRSACGRSSWHGVQMCMESVTNCKVVTYRVTLSLQINNRTKISLWSADIRQCEKNVLMQQTSPIM